MNTVKNIILISPEGNKTIHYIPKDEKNLLQILKENDISIFAPCSGRKKCGNCKVKVSPYQEVSLGDMEFLSHEEIENKIRLACFCLPKEDLTIYGNFDPASSPILSEGYLPDFCMKTSISKKTYRLKDYDIDYRSYEELFKKILEIDEIGLDQIKQIPKIKNEFTGVFYEDRLIKLEENNTKSHSYGLMVDIGTTTISMGLIDLNSSEEIDSISSVNEQVKYGFDVLSRISHCIENGLDGINQLQKLLVLSLDRMIKDLIDKNNISSEYIYEFLVSANTTILHLLVGVDPSNLGLSPYIPVFTDEMILRPKDLGFSHIKDHTVVYLLPSVSSFIGADIVAGAYVANLERDKRNILFIDIGTNGEIILSKAGKLVSCSCAAGPALEGMNIQCGLRAMAGAIEDFKIVDESFQLKVIGNEKPLGICGSGILAISRELIKHDFLKANGTFIKAKDLVEDDYRLKYLSSFNGKSAIKIYDKILVTQKDIRQIQLAKSAIISGMESLVNYQEMDFKDIDLIYIAGQFGSHLPVESLKTVGIIPSDFENEIVYLGNSSRSGAYLALLNRDIKKEMAALPSKITYVDLSREANYERLFISNMNFK